MDDPYRFLSTSHLVGHLIREVESSLRDVLQPLAKEAGTVGEMTKKDKDEKHKFEITSILSLLGIPLDMKLDRSGCRKLVCTTPRRTGNPLEHQDRWKPR
jgi:hypothetical protein